MPSVTMQHSMMAAEPNPAPRPAVISRDLDLDWVAAGTAVGANAVAAHFKKLIIHTFQHSVKITIHICRFVASSKTTMADKLSMKYKYQIYFLKMLYFFPFNLRPVIYVIMLTTARK